MINVKFEKKNNKLVSFNMSGHADFDEYGKDIVCSAVSAISITILNGITDVIHINPPFEIEEGYFNLSLKGLSSEDIDKCSVLMETLLLGFKSMMVNYGEYINFTIEEV